MHRSRRFSPGAPMTSHAAVTVAIGRCASRCSGGERFRGSRGGVADEAIRSVRPTGVLAVAGIFESARCGARALTRRSAAERGGRSAAARARLAASGGGRTSGSSVRDREQRGNSTCGSTPISIRRCRHLGTADAALKLGAVRTPRPLISRTRRRCLERRASTSHPIDRRLRTARRPCLDLGPISSRGFSTAPSRRLDIARRTTCGRSIPNRRRLGPTATSHRAGHATVLMHR